MRVSTCNPTIALCYNTANSFLTIDGKFKIISERIGSVHNSKLFTFNTALHIHSSVNVHLKKLTYEQQKRNFDEFFNYPLSRM